MAIKWHGETWEQFNEQFIDEEYLEELQYHRDLFLSILKTLVFRVSNHWRNQGYIALHYQQEQFEHAAQKHQTVAYEEVQTAAALATSRTAAQATSRFRDTENNAVANFSQQQRGLLPEITSESAQEPEAQRQSLIHEASSEMMRRDTHREEVLSQVRSELQYYHHHHHHHHEGRSDENQHPEAELDVKLATIKFRRRTVSEPK